MLARVKDRLTFGGHAMVVLDLAGRRIVTDPLLRGHVAGFLRARNGLGPGDLGTVDAVLVSHVHHDHLDVPSLKLIGRDVQIVCPAGAEGLLEGHGFTRVLPLRAGDRTTIGDVEVAAVPAVHDGHRTLSRVVAQPIGFVLEASRRVYFAGDTDLFDGMRRIGDGLDVALVPVWGWGPTVGEGHLDPLTAARAVELLSPRLAVPIHWGLLAPVGIRLLKPRMLADPPRVFADAVRRKGARVSVRVLAPGESIELDATVAGA